MTGVIGDSENELNRLLASKAGKSIKNRIKEIKTILANYKKYYQKAVVNRLVKEKAGDRAVQEYRKKSPELFTFKKYRG